MSEEFGTGLTIIDAHGFYSDTPKTVLYVVVNRFQTVKLKTLVKGVDANAYMAISRWPTCCTAARKKKPPDPSPCIPRCRGFL